MAILSFKDMTFYTMKPEKEIVLSRPAAVETKLQLVVGNLWVNVKKMIKDGTMEITMNQAVSGIKGTILVCEQTETTSTVKVIEGEVEFTDKNGKIIKIEPGEMVSATSIGIGPVEKFDIDREKAAWADYLDSESATNDSGKNLGFVIGGSVFALVVILGFLTMLRKKRVKSKP